MGRLRNLACVSGSQPFRGAKGQAFGASDYRIIDELKGKTGKEKVEKFVALAGERFLTRASSRFRLAADALPSLAAPPQRPQRS